MKMIYWLRLRILLSRVIPAKAGIHDFQKLMDARVRGHDSKKQLLPSIKIVRRTSRPLIQHIASFFLFLLVACESGPPPGMTDPGELIYFGYVNKQAQCSRCHGDEGQGGMFGPKISGVVQKLGVDSLRAIIKNGRGEGDKRMPALATELTPEQIEQVIVFLQAWEDTMQVNSFELDKE
jgi:mono/diheme cytochrome c family protein